MEQPITGDSLTIKTPTAAHYFSTRSKPKSKALSKFSDPSTATKTLRNNKLIPKKYAS